MIVILLLSVLFINGCIYQPREDPNWDYFMRCIDTPKYYWDGETQTCKPMEETTGCKTLEGTNIIETVNLPKGYANITDCYETDYFEIMIFCSSHLLKRCGKTCNETFEGSVISYYEIVGDYKLREDNKTIDFCW